MRHKLSSKIYHFSLKFYISLICMENFPIYILYSFQKSEILPNAMLKVITCMGGASDINMWTTDGF